MQTQTPSNPLEQLQDIHVPESVSAWPLAWGWWVVIAVVLAALTAIGIWLFKRHQFLKAKRQAVKEIHTLQAKQSDWAHKQNAILKRTASFYYDQHQVASLYGQRWQQFLVDCLPKRDKSRIAKDINQLQQALYQPQPLNSHQFDVCQKACLHWLNHAQFSKRAANQGAEGSNA